MTDVTSLSQKAPHDILKVECAVNPCLVNFFDFANCHFKSVSAFVSAFAKEIIVINKSYYDSFLNVTDSYECSVKDYFDACLEDSSFAYLCTEHTIWLRLAEMLPPPCDFVETWSEFDRFVFMGNKSCVAPLHFDWDCNAVIFTQLAGKRRILLLPPEAGEKLIPINNTSMMDMRAFQEDSLRRFAVENKGLLVDLAPGQSIYIPPLWWHYLEYLDIGISCNIRYGAPRWAKLFTTLPRHYHLQNIGSKLFEGDWTEDKESIYHELLSSFYRPYSTTLERYQSFHELTLHWYRELCMTEFKGRLIGPNFDPNLAYPELVEKNYQVECTNSTSNQNLSRLHQWDTIVLDVARKKLGLEDKPLDDLDCTESAALLDTLLKYA